jgi:maltose alpha-D-glucosyltransferase/alpha-amylase
VIYYGDEIGMGDNIFLGDRNGIRTPMQWSGDRNAGFSSADPQRLCLPLVVDYEYHHQTVHVEAQQRNRHSLLWWMKCLIALRKRYRTFGRGTLEFRHPANRSVLAFIRRWQDEAILVVANLSRFDQYVEVDLSGFEGRVPVELTGRNPFAPVGAGPYPLTLAPHGFLWLALAAARPPAPAPSGGDRAAVPVVVPESWESLVVGMQRSALEDVLPDYLHARPWFTERRRRILSTSIVETIPVADRGAPFFITLVRVHYAEREPDTYLLPVAWAAGARAEAVRPELVIARATVTDGAGPVEGVLYDAIGDPRCTAVLLSVVAGRRQLRGASGHVAALRTPAFRKAKARMAAAHRADVLAEEQSNSTLLYGDVAALKVFRKVDEGLHPDFAIGDFLTRRRFAHAPAVLGALEYRRRRSEPVVLAILQRFVPNDGDGWQYTLRRLRDFRRAVQGGPEPVRSASLSAIALLKASEGDLPPLAEERLGSYLPAARLLGQRTGELHCALATGRSQLAPEPFSRLYQRSAYQSLRGLTCSVIDTLRQRLPQLPAALRGDAERVAAAEGELLARVRSILDRKLTATRIACHGNYHLQQVLWTGDDFTIIDFEGEPPRPLFERRLKRSPLTDVASMVRSFHYAACVALPDEAGGWSSFWRHWVAATFLKSYLATMDPRLLPPDREDLLVLLDVSLLERTLYELGHELAHRPDWIGIPLGDLREILDEQ